MNIQPGWEGLVYGVLIAAGIAFVLATISVAFGIRAVDRIVRPTSTLGVGTCISVAAVIVAAVAAGYFEVKHLQHPTGHPRSAEPAPSQTERPQNPSTSFQVPIVAVSSGPIGDIVVAVQVPTCAFNPGLDTSSSTETLDIKVSPHVEAPIGSEDPLITCPTKQKDLSIGVLPMRPGMTLTDGQQVFVLSGDGTWTQRSP